MLRYFNNFIKKIKNLTIKNYSTNEDPLFIPEENYTSSVLSNKLDSNVTLIKTYLGHSVDLKVRSFLIPTVPSIGASVVFLDTMVEDQLLESSVIAPLTTGLSLHSEDERASLSIHIDSLIEKALSNSLVNSYENVTDVIDQILLGQGILLIDNYSKGISIKINRGPLRDFAEPKTEKVIKGPQQGFVEDIDVNVSMIRKKIKSSNLVVNQCKIGKESRSELRVIYLNNIADSSIVEELFQRLDRINIDGLINSSSIEECLTDSPSNLFQTTFCTERPDRTASLLLEGRIALLFDGSPIVIIVPSIISDFFISTEDYYQNPYFATFSRFIGYIGAFMLTFFPSIYIAITTFHQEVLPTRLALTIAGARSGVPFPAFLEALLMEIAFESLRQAGTRLPTHVGQAVSIVGALIIGQAAVEAGLVSSAVVIVVAITAIFSFTIPYTNFSLSLRLTRFFMMALAATLGIYGIMTGAFMLALNLISLRSFGVPFMVPFAPLSLQDLKDWFVRFPQWSITKRSSHIVKGNNSRKSRNMKPNPPN
ncbi:spore germination protein [Alkaliphilus transvaalensis]|uniref:spore germination protein n=1 Tax=Alkaliphilus transvaalensis TaxID=114628 RepID=UPI0006891469|nr:spore germination protein [Alkaliphilus transvaalensis]